MKYPLATSSWDHREYEAMQRVIKSGAFTMGDEVRAFERKFAEYLGCSYTVMVNSGSSANLLMMAALLYRPSGPLPRGAEVIVPAVSWSTTYTPLQQLGYAAKFVDIHPATLNIDIDAVRAAVTESTKAILAVNLLGNPADLASLTEIAREHDLVLLEDNCESLGAVVDGRAAGTWGVMGSFSSFFSHHISTMEGGLVATDDEELYHVMLSLRAHGWTRELPDQNRLVEKAQDSFYESFRFVLPGFNLRPLELSGAIGQEQLLKLPAFVRQRRKNAARFTQLFSDDRRFRIQTEHGESSWFGFSFVIDDPAVERGEVVALLSSHNIDCRPIVAGNYLRNPVIDHFDYTVHESCVVADAVHNRGFFVGNSHEDLAPQIDYLFRVLSEL